MSEILRGVWEVIVQIFSNSGYAYFFTADGGWKNAVMLVVAFVFLYLGIKKGFEPLLMIPIAFGMLLANIPSANLAVHYSSIHEFIDLMAGRLTDASGTVLSPGLIDFLYFGVKAGVYPPLIFMGIGAMTDFAPLIANPSSFILGAAASWVSSLPMWARSCLALPLSRPVLSVLSVVRTVLRPFSLPPSWHRNCWVRLLWRRTPIWPWCPLFSPHYARADD